MTLNELAEAVQRHAVVNYEKNGWDYIVECWTREEIMDHLRENVMLTEGGAISLFEEIADHYNQRRIDIEAERF